MRTAIQTLEAKIRDLKITEAQQEKVVRAKLEQWEQSKKELWSTQADISQLEAGLRKLRMPTINLDGIKAYDDWQERLEEAVNAAIDEKQKESETLEDDT